MQETIVLNEGFFDIHFDCTANTVTKQILVDTVNFILHTYNMKNKQIYHYLLLKETLELRQFSTSFEVSFEVYLKEFQK